MAIVRKSAEDYSALRDNGFSVPASIWALGWKNLSKIGQFL